MSDLTEEESETKIRLEAPCRHRRSSIFKLSPLNFSARGERELISEVSAGRPRERATSMTISFLICFFSFAPDLEHFRI